MLKKEHLLSTIIDRYISAMPRNIIRDRRAHLILWRERLGQYDIADITSAHVSHIRDDLKTTLSPATVNRYLATLSHVFNVAIKDWGVTVKNPVSIARKLKEPRGRTRLLTDDERARLLHSCEIVSEELHTLVLLALSTGARAGELMGLTWQDTDLGNCPTLTFRHTKNGDVRSVPIAGPALAKLHSHLRARPIHGHIFTINYHRLFKRACDLAKLHSFTFHDLRHAAASYLVMHGASLRDVAEILGHKSLSMVMRYSHLSREHLRGTLERMTVNL